jgi:hypothetical protein
MSVTRPVELLNTHESVARVGAQAKRRNACLPSMI